MIQIHLLRRLEKRKIVNQSGISMDILRVLCIIQIPDLERMYTPAEVAAIGWPADLHPVQYKIEIRLISSWTQSKDLKLTSDHKDAHGQPAKPYMWTGYGFLERLGDKVYNQAADIINEVCDLRDADSNKGCTDNTYWYSPDTGIMTAHPEQFREVVAQANQALEKRMHHKRKQKRKPSQPKTVPLDERVAELAKAQTDLAEKISDALQTKETQRHQRILKQFGGMFRYASLVLLTIAAFGWYQQETDPRHQAKSLAIAGNWPALRAMYRNPPEGIGRDQIEKLLLEAPTIPLVIQHVVEIDFDAQTLKTDRGTIIGIGEHITITISEGFKRAVVHQAILANISYHDNMPRLILDNRPIDLYPMYHRGRPWFPEEHDRKLFQYGFEARE